MEVKIMMNNNTALEEFIAKRVDEELINNENYNLLTSESIEAFNKLLSVLKEDSQDILFQYEKIVSEMNDMYQKELVKFILKSSLSACF
jgi:hypothetical protein